MNNKQWACRAAKRFFRKMFKDSRCWRLTATARTARALGLFVSRADHLNNMGFGHLNFH
jgi:hypothetical protein